jgi:hypothetical protein
MLEADYTFADVFTTSAQPHGKRTVWYRLTPSVVAWTELMMRRATLAAVQLAATGEQTLLVTAVRAPPGDGGSYSM